MIQYNMTTDTQHQDVIVDEKTNSHSSGKQNNDNGHNEHKYISNAEAETENLSEGHRSGTSSTTGHGEDDASSIASSSHHSDDGHQDGAQAPVVARISTNVSLGPDNPVEHYTSYTEVPDSVYDRFSPTRKLTIVTLLSFCAFLAPISSTTVLSATPEVAAEYGTTGSIVNVTNALYLLFMGISPIVWGPFSEVWGRKVVRRSCCLTCFMARGFYMPGFAKL